MLASFNWLKEFVKIDQDAKTFGDTLTMAGTKVETITPVNEKVKGIVTGKITKIENHPNADRLRVCTVKFGPNKALPIITNAQNVYEGAVVPVALDGAIIDTGTQINASEMRGVRSEGMMCSVKEMGLDTSLFNKDATQNVYIFPEGTESGLDVRELFWVDDQIIDIELTANRGDCQSIYGIAKEMYGNKILFSETAQKEIKQMFDKIVEMFDISKDAFENMNKNRLPELTALENDVDNLKKDLTVKHFARLAEGKCRVEVSPYYYSAISGLERVADHLVNIGYSIVNPVGSQREID